MATEKTDSAAPKRTRKASGPRQAKPLYAIVTVMDEGGNVLKFGEGQVSVKLAKNAAEVLALVNGGQFTHYAQIEAPKGSAA